MVHVRESIFAEGFEVVGVGDAADDAVEQGYAAAGRGGRHRVPFAAQLPAVTAVVAAALSLTKPLKGTPG